LKFAGLRHIIRQSNFEAAREKAAWTAKLAEAWERVRFTDVGAIPVTPLLAGRPMALRAALDLAGLTPADVLLEALVGRVNTQCFLESVEVIPMMAVDEAQGSHVFAAEYVPHQTGRLGYALRISAKHYEDSLTRPSHPLIKWSSH